MGLKDNNNNDIDSINLIPNLMISNNNDNILVKW